MNVPGTSPFSNSSNVSSEAEVLSSPDTVFWARLFPFLVTVPILVFGIVTGVRPQLFAPPAPPIVSIIMLGAAFVLFLITRASLGQFQEVALTDAALLVGPAEDRVVIPFENIATVTENVMMHVNRRHPIVIELRAPTDIGSRVMFLPIGNPPGGWKVKDRTHATTKRLQALVTGR